MKLRKIAIFTAAILLAGCAHEQDALGWRSTDVNGVFVRDQSVIATLETEISSRIPGIVVAVVSQSSSAVMPVGTRLIATYGSPAKKNATRLWVVVERAIRPDGNKIVVVPLGTSEHLGALVELDGSAGVKGVIKDHDDDIPVLDIPGGTAVRFIPSDDLCVAD